MKRPRATAESLVIIPFIVISLCLEQSAHAVENAAPLSLALAVSEALRNNYTVRQAREKLVQTRADTSTARSLLFPNLTLSGGIGEYKGAVENSTSVPFDGNAYNQYTADLKLSQPIFQYGSLSAIRAANDDTKIAELNLEISERTLTNQIIQAFYRVLLNQRLLDILEKTEVIVRQSLATTEHRLHTGRSQLLDVLQVKTQVALLKPQIEEAKNQLQAAGAQLANYVADPAWSGDILRVKGHLVSLRLADVRPRVDLQHPRLPELELIRIQREQVNERKDVTLGKELPTLNLAADYGSLAYTKSDLTSPYTREWSAQLQLTIPLFSGFSSFYERRSYASQDLQLEFKTHDTENNLALQQIQSLKSLESAEASLQSAQEAAELATQSTGEAQRNYRLATIDSVQFLTVNQSSLAALSSLDNIRYQNIVAMANYFVATGLPLTTLMQILEENGP